MGQLARPGRKERVGVSEKEIEGNRHEKERVVCSDVKQCNFRLFPQENVTVLTLSLLLMLGHIESYGRVIKRVTQRASRSS